MWPPPNIQSLPSEQEIQTTKEEISAVELEIIETELKLVALRKSLFERRAWIAPIRTMPHEILSYIFTKASKTNWKALFVLQSVSRRWRDVVLAGATAWTFIPLSKYSIQNRSELIPLFLERSRNIPLHIFVKNSSLLGYMELLAHKIECFHLQATEVILNRYLRRGHVFHLLERLTIIESSWCPAEGATLTDDLAAWEMPLFPNLKVLHIFYAPVSLLKAISAAPEFPAIRHLTVDCRDGQWLPAILTKCAMSLESASLMYENWNSEGLETEHKINLPRLRYLQLVDRSKQERPRLRLKAATPNLQAYLDDGELSTLNAIKVDTHNIILLHVVGAPDLSQYPRLVTLCFSTWRRDKHVIKATECLRDNPALCPDLTLIEHAQLTEEQTAKAKDALMARGDVTRHIIQLARGAPMERKERAQAFRGVETCEGHMPCNSSIYTVD